MDANAADRAPDAGDRMPERSEHSAGDVMAEPVESPPAVGFGLAAPDDYYHPPKPGIVHLVAWIAVAVALVALMDFESLAVTAEMRRRAIRSVQVHLPLSWLASYVRPILSAAGLVGLWVLVRDKLRGVAGRLQPGHWLLLILSASNLFGVISSLSRVALPRQLLFDSSPMFSLVWALISSVVAIALLAVWLHLALYLRETLRWRLVLVAMTVVAVLSLGVVAITWLVPFGLIPELWHLSSLAAFVVLLVAAAIDLRSRRWRDWLHWLGVLMLAWILAYSLLSWIPNVIRRWV